MKIWNRYITKNLTMLELLKMRILMRISMAGYVGDDQMVMIRWTHDNLDTN